MEGSRLKICFTNHDLTSFTIKSRNQHIVMGWTWCIIFCWILFANNIENMCICIRKWYWFVVFLWCLSLVLVDLRMWLSLGGHFLVDHTPQWNFSGSLDLRWSGYPLQSEGQVVVIGLSYHREIKIIIDGPLYILEKHISHLCMLLQSFIENSKSYQF